MTPTLATHCDTFVAALTELGLVSQQGQEPMNAYLRAYPRCEARELADHLVAEGVLTQYQANAVLAGAGNKLILAQFTLVDEIGSGSMGTVYRARSSRDENWYAIKIVPRRNVINLQSIGEKVTALKQIRHPRVSAMMHVGAQGERVYMVWPLLEGGEKLDAVVERQGRLPPRQAAQVALQVASGLQAYHEHELFHGLLKPSDVLIGSDRRVRLLDFGVGFLLTCDRGKSLLDTTTNTRALARGLDCASPESIMDPLDRSPWGDQYSLGCILYYCLAGQFPFPSTNPVKKMMGHQFEEPTPIQQLAPETTGKLAAIVHRLLGKRPKDRYFSTDDVVLDLQKAASDSRLSMALPQRTGPVGPGAPVRPSQLQAMRPSAGGAAPRPEPAAPPEPQTQPDAPQAVPDARRGLWLPLVGMAAGVAAGLLAWYMRKF